MIDGELVTTDEAILDSIGEGDVESNSDEGVSNEDTGTTTDTTEAASTAGSEQGTTDSNGVNAPGKTANGPQDLVDANGKVIAAGGQERRHYETAQRERSRAEGLTREVESLKGQIEAVNAAGTLGTQYELSPEELTTGAQLIASYKNNPIETIQYMLTQAQASGHNIEDIGGGSGMDMKAVQQMLDTALKPLVSEHNVRADTQEANDAALVTYNEFGTKFPDAKPHEDSIARLLQEDPKLSPEAAYYKLQSFYHQRGLDWTKPLDVLQQEADTAKTATPNENTQQALPDGGVTSAAVTDTAQVADVNTSTSDIIRQAMAEHGME